MEKAKFIGNLNKVNKLNKLTMLLLIVVYILIVSVIGVMLHRNPTYKVFERAGEIFGEEVNISTFIMNKITMETKDEKEVPVSKYYVYTLSDAKEDKIYTGVEYDLTLETSNENYVYFDRMVVQVPFSTSATYDSSKRNVITIADQSYSNGKKTTYSYNNQTLTNEGIIKIYGQVNYSYVEEEEKVEEGYLYSREILTLSKNEIKEATETNKLIDLFNIDFYISSKDKEYNRYVLSIRDNDLTIDYKLDAQSFVELESGEILPLCGVYNYADDDKHFTSTNKYLSSENQIAHDINVVNVYVKVRIYTSKDVYQEAVIKLSYQNLVSKN